MLAGHDSDGLNVLIVSGLVDRNTVMAVDGSTVVAVDGSIVELVDKDTVVVSSCYVADNKVWIDYE